MQSPHGTSAANPAAQQWLPGTSHALADLGSIYPTVAFWAPAGGGDEEDPPPSSPEEQAEELDEVIFTGMVAMR